jgi:hypothetical protein
MKPTTKETSQTQKQEARQEAANKETEPKPKATEAKRKDSRSSPKEELKQQQPNSRHTTNPSGSCLGRSLVIPNVRKAQR